MKKKLASNNAPGAIGPYSQGIEASGRMVFVSGQLPIDPSKGEFASNDIEGQTRQSLTNIKNILSEAGLTMDDIVKTTVLLTDIAEFDKMNGVYGEFFSEPYPARIAYQVVALPKGAKVEIEVIAMKGE